MLEGAQVVTEEQPLGEHTAYSRVTWAEKPQVNQWGTHRIAHRRTHLEIDRERNAV